MDSPETDNSPRKLKRKVPQIILVFWVVKLLTTAMGEATSDYFISQYNHYLVVASAGLLLIITLIIQLRTKKYTAFVYWATVSMVAVFGTMAADALHIQFGVPYTVSTAAFGAVLIIVFILWQRSEKTLSIHSIFTTRAELFYWATVMATFALGTAAGDLAANSMGLGYFKSAMVFLLTILVPVALYYIFKVSEVFCFWFAYIVTRPLGASFADWFSKPKHSSGLGYGDGKIAIILILTILVLVSYLAITKKDVKA